MTAALGPIVALVYLFLLVFVGTRLPDARHTIERYRVSLPAIGGAVVVMAVGPFAATLLGAGHDVPQPIRTVSIAAFFTGTAVAGLLSGRIPEYRRLRRGRRSAGDPSGPTAVSGTVTCPEPVEARLSGTDAAWYVARVTQDHSIPRLWGWTRTLVHDERGQPFAVRDRTGRVEVDPANVVVRGDTDLKRVPDPPDDVPGPVAEFLAARGFDPRIDGGSSLRQRTFVERRVEPGEEVTVIGDVRDDDGSLSVAGDPVVVEPGSLDTVLDRYQLVVHGTGVALAVAASGLFLMGLVFGG